MGLLRRLIGYPSTRHARALARRFLDDTKRADQVQRRVLARLLERDAASDFARRHGLTTARDLETYRRRVPIRDYDGHEPDFARVRQGDLTALFGPGVEVLMFAKTSGTTAFPKTIPVTRESLDAYRAGWKIWGIQAFDAHPDMLSQGLKPILQIAGDWRESFTPSGLPCGAITGLTARMQSPLVRLAYCLHPSVGRVKDVDTKYYLALRSALPRDLGTIIAANPATVLGIVKLAERDAATLLRDLYDGTVAPRFREAIPPETQRALSLSLSRKHRGLVRRLESLLERHGRLRPIDYWPHLQFLANWTGGTMGAYLRDYPDWFGPKPVRDVGLIASEGRMTIPIEDHTAAGILDFIHHHFEFLPEETVERAGTVHDLAQADTLEAHELVEGRRYFLLMTTAGGLRRYHIQDVVRCVGFVGKAPLLEFLNKGAHVSSLTGEKLSEFQVVAAVDQTRREFNARWMTYLVLPVWGDPPGYRLLIEADDLAGADSEYLDRLARAIDHKLRHLNEEYANRLDTRRLAPLKIELIASGSWTALQRRRLERGGTLEQYKKPCLLPDLDLFSSFRVIRPPSSASSPSTTITPF